MIISLSLEELTALKQANKFTRIEAISYFLATLPHYDDSETELINFTNNLIAKLRNMSNEQYAGIDYSNAIDTSEYEEES